MGKSNIVRWIANLLVLGGISMIIAGAIFIYPFARDAIQASSDTSALSFVVTPPPSPTTVLPSSPPVSSPPQPAAQTQPSTAAVAPTRVPSTPTQQAPAATPESFPPDRIVIPAIKLDAPVETVGWSNVTVNGQTTSEWDVPARRAAGWLKTSAMPGQIGNTVLDGHHNINGEVFRYVVDLKPGDLITVYAKSQVFTYSVTEKHILPDRDQPLQVRQANAQWIAGTDDDRLTLVTCWPYTNNTHRVIVVARPVAPPDRKGVSGE